MRAAKRTVLLILAALLFALLAAAPAFAASRKKIKSITLEIEASIQPDTRYGEEEIDVDVRSGKCSFDTYDIENDNVGSTWEETDVPQITIYLQADDDYYFALTKASSVKLKGATYVKATKQDSSSTLKLTVELPPLTETLGELEEAHLTDGAYAWWEEVRGAGSYELRVYRDGSGVGVTLLETADTEYDCSAQMTKKGNYYVRVRAVNRENPEIKGEWVDSEAINISAEQAAAIRDGSGVRKPVYGEWVTSEDGYRYIHSDDSFTENGWESIDGEWYFFGENGYMQTGWVEWDDSRYYCDSSGKMLKNTTTPDGYILDSEGHIKTD